jgi:hypothetical protein
MSVKSEREEVLQGRISRRTLLRLAHAAKTIHHYRFLRQITTAWLTSFPGDIEAQRLLAEAWSLDDRSDMAIPILENLFKLDPENKPVTELLLLINRRNADEIEWFTSANQALIEGNYELAENSLLDSNLETTQLLSGILRLKLARRLGDLKTAHALAMQYHEKWPLCLQFRLAVVQTALELGHPDDAVAMLHRCASDDAAGLVARRWLGEGHPFQSLWPEKMSINFDLPIPAEISALLGWNQLPGGPEPEPVTGMILPLPPKSAPPPEIKDLESELQNIASRTKQPNPNHLDGRFPVYIIFTLQKQLVAIYGEKTAEIIVAELQSLADVVRSRRKWGALVFCPDIADHASKFGVTPLSSLSDPWQLKLSLVDLDRSLGHRGERIGALLIVGGPEIIPFHRLPNPLDDPDADVLSDNPYATQDANYYIPEWPVGRFPGESGKDAGLLLQQIRQATRYHRGAASYFRDRKYKKWLDADWWRKCILKLFSPNTARGFGYTAAVWRRSSQAVFRAAGQHRALLASPPQESTALSGTVPLGASLGYYNLHGVPDSAEWFGQREFNDPLPGPDYPIALTPSNLHPNGNHPDIVFSEACYGADLRGEKTAHSSIALRFLSIGTMGFVGSTCTSYGAVTMPLAGADLLAYRFWKLLREGHCVGEALLQAKIQYAQDLMRRQGFLDGEDQKTLISFVLFGDPLTLPEGLQAPAAKGFERVKLPSTVKTVCDRKPAVSEQPSSATETSPGSETAEELIQQVKRVVAPYLPGLDQAKVVINPPHPPCVNPGKNCPGCALSGRSKSKHNDDRTVVIFSQQAQIDHCTHTSIARVTLNREGRITKLALSR